VQPAARSGGMSGMEGTSEAGSASSQTRLSEADVETLSGMIINSDLDI
jgi:hypothetical protein